jgi:putative membrane protein
MVDPTAESTAGESPDLGAMRTLMAANRTLMAWVRTSLSMLSFGFTIYKILEEVQNTGGRLPADDTPQDTGVFLAVAGTVAMVMGTVEYWWTLRQLRQQQHFSLAQPTLIMAVFICVSGALLCVGIIARLV